MTGINYYPTNKISQMKYGNGVQTDYDYYDTAGETDASAGTDLSFRLKQIRVSKGNDLLNLNYEYDEAGNVKVKNDTVNNKYSETYGYDDLNRLTSANSTSYGNKTFQYDIINNITQKDNRNYQYDTTNPYKLVNDGKYGYTYDANGSMIGRSDGRVIGWDVENRVSSVGNGGNYGYNADYQRIKKTENGVTTYYFFNDYEEDYKSGVKSKAVKYYFANKQRVAENSTTNGVRYFHKDHLSSSTAITDATGSLVLRNNYAPYGEDAVSEGNASVKYKFTDKEKDGTGLYYFGARFYDPVVGRFISVDPARDGDNWYAYCKDNPIQFVDPNGKAPQHPTPPSGGPALPVSKAEVYTSHYSTHSTGIGDANTKTTVYVYTWTITKNDAVQMNKMNRDAETKSGQYSWSKGATLSVAGLIAQAMKWNEIGWGSAIYGVLDATYNAGKSQMYSNPLTLREGDEVSCTLKETEWSGMGRSGELSSWTITYDTDKYGTWSATYYDNGSDGYWGSDDRTETDHTSYDGWESPSDPSSGQDD